ncbi:MAG: DNA gyrase/topoisomerase IV subunit A, partial [Cytophagales bacterium]
AVGLATKVMPHNFCELIEASIDILNGKETNIMPDFFMGGIADCSQYRGGMKGGKIRIRSHIEIRGKKDLVIKDIPYGCTTGSLIDSILKANDEGKIKIKKVIDNTAKDVEILVELAAGISPEQTIDALYAFTDCEVSISPNTCVIVGNKPQFIDVNEMLKICTFNTKDLLKEELEIKKNDLLEKILYGSLEKIFIENRIYRDIEECTTWEDVLLKIDIGLTPYKPQFYREIIKDDLIRLTEIKIKRISKYDTFKADELMKSRAQELKETEEHLANLNRFSINYFKNLLKKYGKGRERRTELQSFDAIKGTEVALNNQKLYVNRADGFIGYGLKKDEFVCDCSDIDDIIIFTDDGKYYIKKIGEKVFVAKNIIYLAVFNKDLKDATFNTIYKDGESGISMMKRFQVQGVIRDKEYDLTKGNPKSKLMYFSANLQGETEIVKVTLSPSCSAKNKTFEYNFADLEVKGKTALGNILTKYPVKKIDFKSKSDAAKKKTTDEKAGENALFKGK